MNFRIHLFIAGVCAVLLPTGALAGPCDAYYPFDGNVADAGPNAYDGLLITKGGEPAIGREAFSEGKYGQALRLTGDTAVRVPVDLDPATCPEGTITAWVKFEDSPSTGYQYLVSSGRGNGPSLARVGQHLDLTGGGTRLQEKGALRAGQWMFIAGTWDQPNKGMGLVWRNRTTERSMTGKGIYSLDPDLWIGADDDNMRWPVVAGLIDEVRIYGRQLNLDEIQAARAGSGFAAQDDGGNTSTATGEPGSSSNPFGIGQAPPDDQGAAIEQAGDRYSLEYESEEAALAAQRAREEAASQVQQDQDPEAAAESARQQNELEEQRRDEAAADVEAQASGGTTTPASNPADRTLYGPDSEGSAVLSEVSGYAGAVRRPLEHTLAFINVIYWDEKSDRPCTIQVDNRGAPDFGQDTKRWSSCGNPSGVGENVGFREAVVIRSLRVCNNGRDNRRLKGLQIWGGEINIEGQRIDLPDADAEYLSNCREWGNVARCPAQHLATGIIVHANRATTNVDQIVGLQLICRRIVATYTPGQ
jgi:hypothetical protein